MRRILCALLPALALSSPAAAQIYFENGSFDIPVPNPGGFALVDLGERYGEWRVVGQPGNVAWINGTYVHNGFSFVAPPGTSNWVNLAAISRSATGIVHFPVPTVTGSQYTLTFSVGNLVDPTGVYGTSSSVAVYENSTLLTTATNNGGAGSTRENWQKFSVTFTADAPYTTVAFVNADPPTDMNCGIGDTNLAPVAAAHRPAVALSAAKP